MLFYETEWYRPQIASHPRIVHAFGINTDIMHHSALEDNMEQRVWNWTFVGQAVGYKRPWKMLDKKGMR